MAEVEQARAERPRRSNQQKKEKTGPQTVVIKTGKVHYVDEFGKDLPDFTAEAMVPVWIAVSAFVKRLGYEPFDRKELAQLSEASAPVAQKWAGFLLPYMAEIALVGTVLVIMYPRVEARKAAEDAAKGGQNKAAAQQPSHPHAQALKTHAGECATCSSVIGKAANGATDTRLLCSLGLKILNHGPQADSPEKTSP